MDHLNFGHCSHIPKGCPQGLSGLPHSCGRSLLFTSLLPSSPSPSGNPQIWSHMSIGNATKRCTMSRRFGWRDSHPVSSSVDLVRGRNVRHIVLSDLVTTVQIASPPESGTPAPPCPTKRTVGLAARALRGRAEPPARASAGERHKHGLVQLRAGRAGSIQTTEKGVQ